VRRVRLLPLALGAALLGGAGLAGTASNTVGPSNAGETALHVHLGPLCSSPGVMSSLEGGVPTTLTSTPRTVGVNAGVSSAYGAGTCGRTRH
jgi:hypothetical protein